VEQKQNHNISGRLEHLIQNLRSNAPESYKLALPTTDGLIFIKLSEILYCEASSNYTVVYTVNKNKYIVSRTLKQYEDLLMEHNFFRIHNSYLINLNAVKKYVRGDGGYVVLDNDISLDVSKRKKDAFLTRIGARVA
jgi:two-component system LytT family response regulator